MVIYKFTLLSCIHFIRIDINLIILSARHSFIRIYIIFIGSAFIAFFYRLCIHCIRIYVHFIGSVFILQGSELEASNCVFCIDFST
jgi:hypothetical protein